MNSRQRYIEALTFGKPDKIPFSPGGPRESTLRTWHQQGLPAEGPWFDHLLQTLGIEKEPTQPHISLDVSFKMIPQFEEKVLEHRDGHYIVQDWMGAITEISDEFDYTYIRSAKDFVTRKWHRFPVLNRKDFEERMRWRYDPKASGRFPTDFLQRCQAVKDRDYPLGVSINGPFWQLREWLGMENLCMLMLDDPDFAMDLCNFWGEFVEQTLQPILDNVKLDSVHYSEDMAYKAHSMISPAMARKFLMPQYERWNAKIEASGCKVIDMDSDGEISVLIPIWIDSGINVCDPIEVAAGNDIVAFRKRFGKKMAYTGGIDKRALAAGGEVMKAEVMRVVPPLLVDGGFIPGCDHGVPPDISWPNFIEYSRLLAKLTGWL
jgi:hypothetical protein